MKQNSEQFESNISRLVKLSGDSERPSEHFTEKLIGEALGTDTVAKRPEMERTYPMKRKWMIRISIAACLLLMVGVVGLLMMPRLNKVKKIAQRSTIPNVMYERSSPVAHYHMVLSTPAEMPDGASVSLSDRMGPAHGGTTPPNGEPFDAMFFKNYGVNPFIDTDDDRFSTFATDVDTGSYTLCRSYLERGELPPRDAVRVEEFVNYFKYDYPAPQRDVFAVYTDAAPWRFAPDRPNTYLMRIGLKAFDLADEHRKPAVLTFVIDVSGSMAAENRLGLVKDSLRLLIDHLRPDDKIGIAVYGSNGRKILDHTDLTHKELILGRIDSLHTDGSTNAEEGIRIGYEMAGKAFQSGWINRVILCSDGVANVGRTGPDDIFKFIKSKVDAGITLSALGFGMSNYNDVLMEQLGDKGNGHYAYIDTLDEAKRIFCGNLTQMLQVIARDVKLQIEFNPAVVRSYRLIGYENRNVPDEKFRDNKQDGGEIGPGHTVTAMYEVKFWPDGPTGNLATMFVRYKDPDNSEVTEFQRAITPECLHDSMEKAGDDFLLAAAVTEFAEILRESYWSRGAKIEQVLDKTTILRNRLSGDEDIAQLDKLVRLSHTLLLSKEANPEPENEMRDHFLEP